MNTNTKKALVVFGGGLLLYWAFTKIRPLGGSKKGKGSTQKSGKVITDEQKKNAIIVTKAYSDAMKASENKAFLDEMNAEFAKTYGLRVLTNKATGSLFATDLEGNKVS